MAENSVGVGTGREVHEASWIWRQAFRTSRRWSTSLGCMLVAPWAERQQEIIDHATERILIMEEAEEDSDCKRVEGHGARLDLRIRNWRCLLALQLLIQKSGDVVQKSAPCFEAWSESRLPRLGYSRPETKTTTSREKPYRRTSRGELRIWSSDQQKQWEMSWCS